MIDRPRNTFTRIDVPAGGALEPAAPRPLQPPPVPRAFEGDLGHDGIGAHHLEIEAWPDWFFHEPKLHQCRFEQHAAFLDTLVDYAFNATAARHIAGGRPLMAFFSAFHAMICQSAPVV